MTYNYISKEKKYTQEDLQVDENTNLTSDVIQSNQILWSRKHMMIRLRGNARAIFLNPVQMQINHKLYCDVSAVKLPSN